MRVEKGASVRMRRSEGRQTRSWIKAAGDREGAARSGSAESTWRASHISLGKRRGMLQSVARPSSPGQLPAEKKIRASVAHKIEGVLMHCLIAPVWAALDRN